ncbi:hypothetical protein Lal_00000918 [Lupinus albus]|nr:hypothetical protein Lal_00000918 [Lupinus albus]
MYITLGIGNTPLALFFSNEKLCKFFYKRSKSPLKVTTFAWKLFLDKIPSKVALQRRGITLSIGARISCSFCKDTPKTSNHLFLSCHISYSVWQLVYNWLDISVTLPSSPFHHFICHMGMVKDKKGWSLWSVLWFAIMWTIWLSRNELIFNNVESSPK